MARILVIDDEPIIREYVRHVLSTEGHEVFEAGDGAAALATLEGHPAEVVVTDLYMPGMDGLEFARVLRRGTSRPAVVAMSGGGFGRQADVLDAATSLGAVAKLSKPFSQEQLLLAVDRALGKGTVS